MAVFTNIIIIIFTIGVSYLLGSISNATIWTKKYANVDIRTLGSKNAGFTNVIRTVGGKAALCTFIGDFLKGLVSVAIGKYLFLNFFVAGNIDIFLLSKIGAYIAGVSCVIGHIYPCFFQFKGGKGVLTTASIVLMIDWRVFLISIGVFLIVLLITRVMSISSICGATMFPISTFFLTYFVDYLPNKGIENAPSLSYVVFSTSMAVMIGACIIFMHKANIKRLINGTEPKFTVKKKEK